MTSLTSGLALAFVILIPLGRSGLPMNAQWGDLIFPFLVLASMRSGSQPPWWRREDWPVAMYLAATLIAALASPDPTTGLAQVIKQAYVASIFLVFRSLASDRWLSARLQGAFVLAAAVVASVSIPGVFLLKSGHDPLSTFGFSAPLPIFGLLSRLRGAFESPEFFGNFLLVAFALGLGCRQRARGASRLAWTGIAALFFASEFLTFSHSVAGFGVAAALLIGPLTPSRGLRAMVGTGVLVVVVVVNAASVIDPIPRNGSTVLDVRPVSLELAGARVEGRLMSYAALKQVAWSAFLEHPLLGIGPGRFRAEAEGAFERGRLTRRLSGLAPHCEPAGRLAEAGALGLLTLLALWGSWFRAMSGSGSVTSRGAARAAVLGLLVNSLNADVMNFRFLWLVLAWAWPGLGPSQREVRSTRP